MRYLQKQQTFESSLNNLREIYNAKVTGTLRTRHLIKNIIYGAGKKRQKKNQEYAKQSCCVNLKSL